MAPPNRKGKRKLHEMEEKKTETVSGGKNGSDFVPPLSLPLIRARVDELHGLLPSVAATQALTMDDLTAMDEWCKTVRYIIRNFNLVLNFITGATYQWAPERTGNTNQNLAALREYKSDSTSKLDIVINHCNRILTPNISTVLRKKVKTVDGTTETEIYHYEDVVDDQDLLTLNRQQLVEEGLEKRALVEITMANMSKCIKDFLKAEESSSGTGDYRSGMAY